MRLALFLLVAVLGAIGISFASLRRGEKRSEEYSGLEREEFVDHFSAQGIPESVSKVVYDTFKNKFQSRQFKPSPEMSLEAVFEQDAEDSYDDALHILKVLQIPAPNDETLERWDGPDVKTISDVVFWTDWVRRRSDVSG